MNRFASTFAVLAVLAAAPATRASESFQPVRVDTTFLVAYGSGNVAAYGVGAAVEPKYNLTDQIAVGARVEGAAVYQAKIETGIANTADVAIGLRALSGYLVKADFYPLTGHFRPFVGLGMGLFRIASSTTSSGSGGASVQAAASSAFGMTPQFGLNLGAFRMAGTYHWITGKDSVLAVSNYGVYNTVKLERSFWAFEIGGTFGGKRTVGGLDD